MKRLTRRPVDRGSQLRSPSASCRGTTPGIPTAPTRCGGARASAVQPRRDRRLRGRDPGPGQRRIHRHRRRAGVLAAPSTRRDRRHADDRQPRRPAIGGSTSSAAKRSRCASTLTYPHARRDQRRRRRQAFGPTGFETDRLTVSASGRARLAISALEAKELTVTGSGAIKMEVAGRTVAQRIRISGAGDYRAAKLESETAKVTVSGAGRVVVLRGEDAGHRPLRRRSRSSTSAIRRSPRTSAASAASSGRSAD